MSFFVRLERLPHARRPGAVAETAGQRPACSDEEKLEAAEQILSTMSRVGKGPRTMYELWASFGDRVVLVAVANAELWTRCAAYVPRPWELHNIPAVKKVALAFRRDTERVADRYLTHNHGVVEAEKERVFGTTAGARPGKRIANPEAVRIIRAGAELVLRHNQRRAALRQIVVGREFRLQPTRFDPAKPPYEAKGGTRSWESVKVEDDQLRKVVSTILSEQPALFALLRAGELESFHLSEETDPQIGRGRAELALSSGLDTLQADIEAAQMALGRGELEPFDFLPIHKRLLNGRPRWLRALDPPLLRVGGQRRLVAPRP